MKRPTHYASLRLALYTRPHPDRLGVGLQRPVLYCTGQALCHSGTSFTAAWSEVTCPACLALKALHDQQRTP